VAHQGARLAIGRFGLHQRLVGDVDLRRQPIERRSLYIIHHGPRSMASRGMAGWKFAAAPTTGPVVSLKSMVGGRRGGRL